MTSCASLIVFCWSLCLCAAPCSAVEEIARFADVINTTRENIGARRLATVVQVVVEEISFLAHRYERAPSGWIPS